MTTTPDPMRVGQTSACRHCYETITVRTGWAGTRWYHDGPGPAQKDLRIACLSGKTEAEPGGVQGHYRIVDGRTVWVNPHSRGAST